MLLVRLVSALALATLCLSALSAPPAQAAPSTVQYKIRWHVIGTKILFSKKETEKFAAGAGTVAAMGALYPPPFDIVIVGVSSAVAGIAASAVIDGKCVGIKLNPPLPFMPLAYPFTYKPSKSGDGRYCK
ncbi:MAG TPA: hypothetical protein VFX43_08115 [Chitinophagaceae bacterium]|nr:hypothetical protein [Chitinophagaceae bacterium]